MPNKNDEREKGQQLAEQKLVYAIVDKIKLGRVADAQAMDTSEEKSLYRRAVLQYQVAQAENVCMNAYKATRILLLRNQNIPLELINALNQDPDIANVQKKLEFFEVAVKSYIISNASIKKGRGGSYKIEMNGYTKLCGNLSGHATDHLAALMLYNRLQEKGVNAKCSGTQVVFTPSPKYAERIDTLLAARAELDKIKKTQKER